MLEPQASMPVPGSLAFPSGSGQRSTREPSIEAASLLVFSDDWGRHPSSSQHLIRRLLPRYRTLWVNTIGTRTPRWNLATFRRVMEKLRHWRSPAAVPAGLPASLAVVHPRMWPWFTRSTDRWLNRVALVRQLARLVESLPQPVVAVTTLPITADLPGRLPVAKWVYYCVDDFGAWPGLDGRTLARMDVEMLRAADEVVTVSQTLQDHAAAHGRKSLLLTHGVDLEHWQQPASGTVGRDWEDPVVLFWGVVDRRMDTAFIKALASRMERGTIALVGPAQDPDPQLLATERVAWHPPVPFAELPALAARAAVLIMPYADLPVTRAMQPLKLKEYLATGRPTVVRCLPAVDEWDDCLDAVHTPDEFADCVLQRLATGVPVSQQMARRRLANESWNAKAEIFASALCVNFDGRRERKVENTICKLPSATRACP